MIQIPLRPKYRVTQPPKRQKGGGNDQGTKHANHHKVSDKERALIRQQQPRKVMVLLASGKRVMRVEGQ